MRKLLLSLACLFMLVGGFGYMGRTLALTQKQAEEGKGIEQTTCARTEDNRLEEYVHRESLLPSVYVDDYCFDTDKTPTDVKYGNETYSIPLWNGVNGARDQIVFVKNERSDAPCYFRTYVAFEDNGVFAEHIRVNWNGTVDSGKRNSYNYTIIDLGTMELEKKVTLEKRETDESGTYRVFCATYNDALAAGKTAAPSLLQVAMAREADNDDMKKLGERYTVIVASEAIWAESEQTASADVAEEEAKLINGPEALNYLSAGTLDGNVNVIDKEKERARIKTLLEKAE